ncbi:MAG: transaldolase family protein, partial [Anaerolineales bacterium]
MSESVLDRLQMVHPDLEIWWDSSPLIFESWVKKMIDEAPADKKALLDEQLNRIYVLDDPAKSIVRGCTTNPPLSLGAVKNDPKFWDQWIDNLIKSNSGLSQHEYSWLTYKEVIRRGAEMMMPIWEASGGKYGYVSGQLDPRLITETEKMIEDAKQIAAIAPNLMIKVPGSG